ncbi:MAG: hypothetical protein NUV57_01730 [archaeon]|nr:hypothetical protein [archaeon]
MPKPMERVGVLSQKVKLQRKARVKNYNFEQLFNVYCKTPRKNPLNFEQFRRVCLLLGASTYNPKRIAELMQKHYPGLVLPAHTVIGIRDRFNLRTKEESKQIVYHDMPKRQPAATDEEIIALLSKKKTLSDGSTVFAYTETDVRKMLNAGSTRTVELAKRVRDHKELVANGRRVAVQTQRARLIKNWSEDEKIAHQLWTIAKKSRQDIVTILVQTSPNNLSRRDAEKIYRRVRNLVMGIAAEPNEKNSTAENIAPKPTIIPKSNAVTIVPPKKPATTVKVQASAMKRITKPRYQIPEKVVNAVILQLRLAAKTGRTHEEIAKTVSKLIGAISPEEVRKIAEADKLTRR